MFAKIARMCALPAQQDAAGDAENRGVSPRHAIDQQTHIAAMRKAAGVSYLTLVCHEDTWTFVARRAFGSWEPEWITSVTTFPRNSQHPHYPRFTVEPNLPVGRITKFKAGMQETVLSGHNLVEILAALRTGERRRDPLFAARCRTLYGKFHEFVCRIDPDAASGTTTGVRFWICDSVAELPQTAT
ncbi:MAG TPA: hypothetical protein VGX23_18670 [Actinocrinis sp.]|nr:hypothetical protein [Actinocrinis sp.]